MASNKLSDAAVRNARAKDDHVTMVDADAR
jgi:hypothetical protein